MNLVSSTAARVAASLIPLQALVKDDLARVNAVILARAQSDVALIPAIARHIVASGRSRLPPDAATLLHDDVVDESSLRRGLATANNVWGNKASVLVGDFLLSQAFQMMVEGGSLRVLEVLSSASAVIAEGEVQQLVTAGDLDTAEDVYLAMIGAKTARLFAAACELGAVVAEKESLASALFDFGHHLGMAFQIVDDMLDYTASETILGKGVGDDFREGKITIPVLAAYRHGDSQGRAFWQRTMVEHLQETYDFAQALRYLQESGALEQTRQLAENYCDKARTCLNNFPKSAALDALRETIDFCIERAY